MSIQSVRRLLMAANVVSVLLLVLIATAFMHPQSRCRADSAAAELRGVVIAASELDHAQD